MMMSLNQHIAVTIAKKVEGSGAETASESTSNGVNGSLAVAPTLFWVPSERQRSGGLMSSCGGRLWKSSLQLLSLGRTFNDFPCGGDNIVVNQGFALVGLREVMGFLFLLDSRFL
ncbi:hypothetical protein VNO77_14370 [Canavalia gladiata]|uniref:Uncharacterized protein n=1 Tax=Canavalia gladiata TaxID=3824 RepID=A0AAN9M1T6_CANGL